MINIKKLHEWLIVGAKEYYYLRNEMEKISSLALVGLGDCQITLETQHYPKDTVKIYVDPASDKAYVTVITESSFLKAKQEVTSEIKVVEYLSKTTIAIETGFFEFSISRSEEEDHDYDCDELVMAKN